MKTNEQGKYGINECFLIALQNIDKHKACAWYVSIIISIIGIILAFIIKEDNNIVGCYIALLSGVTIFSFFLFLFINICKDEKCSCRTRILLSFLANFIFLIAPTYLINNYLKENNPYVYVSSIIGIILLIIMSYFSIKIENGNDISLLKASNLFLAFLFTAIKLIFKEKEFLVEYYYLLPLIGLQGLYELFDGKTKRKNKEDCKDENKRTINEIQ